MSTYADFAVEFAKRAKSHGPIPDEALINMLHGVYGQIPGLRERLVEEGLIGSVTTAEPADDFKARYTEALATLFGPIIGYDDVKKLLMQALKARCRSTSCSRGLRPRRSPSS